MRKKFINKFSASVLAALMLGVLLTGCGGTTKTTSAPAKPAASSVKKIVATYVQSPLNVPSIVEKEQKAFEAAFKAKNIPFAYSTITSGADQTAALASGDIQFLNCVGGSSVLLAASNGADIKILSLYSSAPKAFKLFGKKGINSPQDLKGKTIAGPKGTILHELLAAYLKKGGLTMKDVKFVSMSIPAGRSALEAGSVDAALMAGPIAYTAEKNGLHVITSGEGLVSGLTVTATSQKFYAAHKDLAAIFLKVQQDTIKYIASHQKEAIAMTAKVTDLKPGAVEEMYKLYDFSMNVTSEAKASLKSTQDFLLSSGMMEKKVDVDKLFI